MGVPPSGGGPERLVIAVVFKELNKSEPDLNQLRVSFNLAVQKQLNPLFRVSISPLLATAYWFKCIALNLEINSLNILDWYRFLMLCLSHLFQGQQQIR